MESESMYFGFWPGSLYLAVICGRSCLNLHPESVSPMGAASTARMCHSVYLFTFWWACWPLATMVEGTSVYKSQSVHAPTALGWIPGDAEMGVTVATSRPFEGAASSSLKRLSPLMLSLTMNESAFFSVAWETRSFNWNLSGVSLHVFPW